MYPSPQQASNPKTDDDSENYNLELTQEEKDRILSEALRLKNQRAKTNDYWQMIENSKKAITTSPQNLLNWVVKEFDFEIDDYNRKEIQLLSQYFCDDAEFEKDGRSLKKGILLMGNIGCGKTFMMKCLCNAPKMNFKVIPATDVCEQFKAFTMSKRQDESDVFLKFNRKVKSFTGIFNKSDDYGWCIDDLGTENTVVSFGQTYNVLQQVLEKAYHEGFMPNIHITTNLTGDEIELKYGKRIRSRMREMFNVIDFHEESPDRRI